MSRRHTYFELTNQDRDWIYQILVEKRTQMQDDRTPDPWEAEYDLYQAVKRLIHLFREEIPYGY